MALKQKSYYKTFVCFLRVFPTSPNSVTLYKWFHLSKWPVFSHSEVLHSSKKTCRGWAKFCHTIVQVCMSQSKTTTQTSSTCENSVPTELRHYTQTKITYWLLGQRPTMQGRSTSTKWNSKRHSTLNNPQEPMEDFFLQKTICNIIY